MGRSPLDTAFGSASTQEKRSKKGFAYLALLGVAGLASASSVFAANVSINGGSAISYSQGTTTIAACDPDGIDVAPGAVYVAADEEFVLDTVSLDGVDAACDTKDLDLSFYDTAGALMYSETVTVGLSSGAQTIGTAGSAISAGTFETGYDAADLANDATNIVIEITD